MATTLPNQRAMRTLPTAVKEAGWWMLVVLASLGTAALTMRSLQWGCTAALVVLAVGTYLANRSAGLAVMWTVWLLVPGLRRVLALEAPTGASDPLSLAPFLITGCIVSIELYRARMSRFAAGVLTAAGCGYLIGVPAAISAPQAMAFALLAYTVAVGCFVIGYREPPRIESLTLRRVLLIVTPLLALYGVRQYIGPLPRWDNAWLGSLEGQLTTVGAPEPGHVRAFATLNSPGTLAAVLGLAAVCFLAQRRFDLAKLAGIALVLTALLLTYTRGAWVGVVVGILVVVAASRGRAGWRVVFVGILLVATLSAVAGKSATGQTIVGRVHTLGRLGSDRSAQQRVATPQTLIPEAVAAPLGRGLGSAGEASRLTATPTFQNTDNGYLSLLYQVGPLGFALVMAAAIAAGVRAVRSVRLHGGEPIDVLVIGMLGFLAFGLLTGDLLYGITGMIFWYLLGVGVRRSELRP
ncbi:MAG TPA: O-antigen ligase family protein [Solirubrobacteraceae bacterium]|jgi:hypothetical protein